MVAIVQQPFQSGPRLIDGTAINSALNAFALSSYSAGITATPSGSQTTSQTLTATVNEVSTVTTTNDGVALPQTATETFPSFFFVANRGANTMKVFAQGSDKINTTAGATGVTLAANTNAIYFSVSSGFWYEIQGT